MTDSYQFQPDIFQLLVDTIPLLRHTKMDGLDFFRGSGLPELDMPSIATQLRAVEKSVNKYKIVRQLLGTIDVRTVSCKYNFGDENE